MESPIVIINILNHLLFRYGIHCYFKDIESPAIINILNPLLLLTYGIPYCYY